MKHPIEWVSVDCDCKSPRHTIRFCFDPEDGELYLDVQLARWPGFFRRCWYAFKYVINWAEPESHWDCVILSESTETLLDLIGRADKVRKEKCESRTSAS